MLSQGLQRPITAIKKLAFCFKVSSTVISFLKLLKNTKRFAWSGNKSLPDSDTNQKPVCYSLTLQDVPRHIYLRTYEGDLQIFYEIFWRSIYSLPSPIFLQSRVIVDIGAHTGIAALYFKLKAPQAKIYALEADDKNYKVLLQNLDPEIKNRYVIPIHAALADHNETIYLQRSKLSFNTSVSASRTDLTVRGIEIKKFLEDYNITAIDILKIDIEGAESFLFSREATWLDIVKNILIEVHSDTNMKQFEKAALDHHFLIEKRISEYENIYWAHKSSAEVYTS